MLKLKITLLFFTSIIYSQKKIEATVYNEYLEPTHLAKIKTTKGLFITDVEGKVFLKLSNLPQKIRVSLKGYETKIATIVEDQENINIVLNKEKAINKIVISASRTPERILESPSDILQIGSKTIENSIGDVYESLSYLPGVQLINNYNSFKSINTRGFSEFENSRFVLHIDGMDSAIPASSLNQGDLDLPVDLDLNNIEILPCSSSALYGANTYNGLMVITTKNPFEHTGTNFKLKTGVLQQDKDISPTYEFSIRKAYKFSESFAAKINLSYEIAGQWLAQDYRNINVHNGTLNDKKNPAISDYNGVNIYGDEEIGIYDIHFGYEYYDPNDPSAEKYKKFKDKYLYYTRIGFTEKDLIEKTFKNKSIKFNNSLNFRPFRDKKLEFIVANNISLSDKIIQGNASRYVMQNFFLWKSKIEFKGDNFFLRLGYSTNKTDKAYNLNKLAVNVNNKLVDHAKFNKSYKKAYLDAFLYNPIEKLNLKEIRLKANTDAGAITRGNYKKFLKNSKNTSVLRESGSAIYDNSNYLNFEGNYNASKLLFNIVNFQIGGSYRRYNTNSKGTLFNDFYSGIEIGEYGVYTQIQKKTLDNRLKFTGSIRYDKNDNFKGNISPRIALNYVIGKDRNRVIRASYQTGYRNPSMEEMYAVNKVGERKHIVGTAKNNNISIVNPLPTDFVNDLIEINSKCKNYNKYKNQKYEIKNTTQEDVFGNALLGFPFNVGNNNKRTFKLNKDYGNIKPENVRTFEIGYRSLFTLSSTTNLDIKVSAYYSNHENFISLLPLTLPLYDKFFPEGEGYFTDKEIAQFQINNGDEKDVIGLDGALYYSLNTKRNSKGKRQYIGSDIAYTASISKGAYKEVEIYTNMKSVINSYGYNIAGKTRIFNLLDINANYSFMDYEFIDKDNGLFKPNFNSPKHSVKIQIGSEKLIGNLGFNLGMKWSDAYYWQSKFVSGQIPSRTLVDTQFTYNLNKLHSTIKLGGTNIGGKEYSIAPGTGSIGKSYYISWVFEN